MRKHLRKGSIFVLFRFANVKKRTRERSFLIGIFEIFQLAFVDHRRAFDISEIVGHHKVGIFRQLDRIRIIKNECNELRAGEFVHPFERKTERHRVRAPEIVCGFLFVPSEIGDQLLCFLIALVADVDREKKAGGVRIAGKDLGVNVLGDKSCEYRQIYVSARIAVEVVSSRIETERCVRICAPRDSADNSRGHSVGAREKNVYFFHFCTSCALVVFIIPQK